MSLLEKEMQKLMLWGLFDLFEWPFQIKFGKEGRQAFSDEPLREQNDYTASEQYLVVELIRTRDALLTLLPPAMQEAKARVRSAQ